MEVERSWLLFLLSGPDFDKLELTLVSFPIDLKLLGGPVADGACAELLLRESYIRYLLGTFV